MFSSIGSTEWIVIGIVVLLLFGGKRIPEFFKGIADAINEFKKASKDKEEEKKS